MSQLTHEISQEMLFPVTLPHSWCLKDSFPHVGRQNRGLKLSESICSEVEEEGGLLPTLNPS